MLLNSQWIKEKMKREIKKNILREMKVDKPKLMGHSEGISGKK
jgi:hypothetical protein